MKIFTTARLAMSHRQATSCTVLGSLLMVAAWLVLGILPVHAGTPTMKTTVKLIVTDAQGTVVAKMTPQGQVTYTAAYRPYGKQAEGAPQAGPGYTGHVNDPDTGLVYMQQRYYDPDGRFISPDPVGPTPGNIYSFNRYAYANNNPVMNIDPDGRKCFRGDGAHCNPEPRCDAECHRARQRRQENKWIRAFGGSVLIIQDLQSPGHCGTKCQDAYVGLAGSVAAKYHIKGSGYYMTYNPYMDAGTSGLTSPWGKVELGPSSFASESWLASTLGHEIEVHWDRQMQFFGGWVGAENYYRREVQAYKYNVRNFKRFGNTPEEQVKYLHRLQYNERLYNKWKAFNGH